MFSEATRRIFFPDTGSETSSVLHFSKGLHNPSCIPAPTVESAEALISWGSKQGMWYAE